MKKLGKKGFFDTINAGMIAFLTFTLVVLLTVLLVSQVSQTSIVCEDTYRDGQCLSCPALFQLNSSGAVCCNATGGEDFCIGANQTAALNDASNAFNATLDLREAANLPPQFSQIIVITIIIVGILGMLSFIGFSVYQRMKR